MLTLFCIFLTTFAIILVFDHPVYGLRRYEKPSCEFVTPNYTLEWAFEPLSRSVVFVLRAEFQDVGDSLWTGVGFGDRNNDSIIDFIGVFVKDSGAQTGITDTHINSTTGQFTPDVNTNVQTISIAVSNAAGSTGTQVTAKFARAINSKDTQEDLDLDGCTIFNVPLQPMASVDHSEQQGNYLKSLKQLKVCDIQKHCTVDIRELKLKGETKVIKKLPEPISPPKPSTEDSKKAHESSAISKPHLQASPSVEVAHSVDISGKGDPCSFTGPNYSINWSYNKGSDCVDFVMKHSVKKGKWWSTVGIGDNMSDMDIGVLFLEDGKVKKIIDYYSHSYGPPDEDKDQNWVLHSSKSKLVSSKSGDQVELHFSRVINSPDIEKDKSMDGCVLFQFGASIGKYGVSGNNYSVRKHEEWPDLYKACDLKKRCLQDKHHQYKRGGDALVVGQSVDDLSTDNTTALLQPPIGNSTELEGPQGSVESDGIVALLTQEITTTTTTTDSTTAQETKPINTSPSDNTQEQRQPTADVIGSTLTTLLPNSTADDADLLLSSSSANFSSSLQPLDSTNNNPQISDTSPLPSPTSDQTLEPPTTTPSNQTQDDSETAHPTLLSLFGEFSTTELFSPIFEPSTTTAQPGPSVWSFLHLSTVPNGQGNESTTTTTTTTSSPLSSSTIETITSEVLSDWASTLATVVEAGDKGLSTTTDSKSSTTTLGAADNTTSNVQTTTSSTSTTSPLTTTSTTTSSTTTRSTTSTTSNPVTDKAEDSQGLKTEGCQVLKPDLDVCKSYMTTYFGQVQSWADKHQEPMENQFGKACKLLSAVPHVPTLCCQIFKNKCSTHL